MSACNNFNQPGGDPLKGLLDIVNAVVTFKVQVGRRAIRLASFVGGSSSAEQEVRATLSTTGR